MTDKKISALTAASTPLSGTEVLPVVQSGTTVKVSVANLTAGRNVAMADLTTTGNTILGDATTDTLNVGNGGLVKDASGNVGVGNLTPTIPFEVTKNGTAAGSLGYSVVGRFVDGSGNKGLAVGYADASQTTVLTAATSATSSNMGFWTYEDGGSGWAERIRINSNGSLNINNGNLGIGTAGKGIDFSANTGAAGMTSELLNWYEEGTWTPTDASGAGLTFTSPSGHYTRIGRIVTAFCRVTYPVTASTADLTIGGLPFTVANNAQPGGGFVRITDAGRSDTVVASGNSTNVLLYSTSLVAASNANYSGKRLDWVVIYIV